MCNERGCPIIPNLYQRVRSNPEAVAQEWAGLPEAERQVHVRRLLETCPPLGYRPSALDIPTAARQLVVAEVVEAYRVQCSATPEASEFWALDIYEGTGKSGERFFKKSDLELRPLDQFYESDNPKGQKFYESYNRQWMEVARQGPIRFLSSPDRIQDLVRTIGRGREPASPIDLQAVRIPQKNNDPRKLSLSLSTTSASLYLCEDFVPTPQTLAVVQDGIQWMVDQGYRPVSIALRSRPGGAHRDGTRRPPCDHSNFKFKGMYVMIGVYPDRTPCTIRHEVLHAIYHQLEKNRPDVIRRVGKIYKQAMAADAGLIFNDEFYMDVFLHAGHPMHDANEFFASAAHAFTHHADRLVQYVQDPKTPAAVRDYAIAMWRLLKTDVFQGKVFTSDSRDPFDK